MKQREFPLFSKNPEQWRRTFKLLEGFINNLDRSGNYEIVVRPKLKNKTMKQLGAIFALWYPYILDKLPEDQVKRYVQDDPKGMAKNGLHRELKNQFLTPVIIMSASSKNQWRWVDQLADIGEMLRSDNDNTVEMAKRMQARHMEELSVADLNIEQMTQYMRNVEEGMWIQGINVPIPDKFWKQFPPRYAIQAI